VATNAKDLEQVRFLRAAALPPVPPRETVAHFLGAIRMAADLITAFGPPALETAVAGSVYLGRPDPRRPKAVGWYRTTDDAPVVVARVDASTSWGRDPARRHGQLQGGRSYWPWVVVHELAHRAWRRLGEKGRGLWKALVKCAEDAPPEAAAGVAGADATAYLLLEPGQRELSRVLRDHLSLRPDELLRWLERGSIRQALGDPTWTDCAEVWPEAVCGIVLASYPGRQARRDARETAPVVAAVVARCLQLADGAPPELDKDPAACPESRVACPV